MESKHFARLSKVAGYQTLELTHYGRKSGKPYKVAIWYLVEAGRLYLVSANSARNWVRNVMVRPKVSVGIGGETFMGEVRRIEDREERDHVVELAESKYWWAAPIIWLGQALASAGLIDDRSAAFEVVISEG
ncbi:MAG TPA: nitroreductase family deazaflavin-dependent oxidoreductase [Candidatus Binataceae bacterium]|nr:nitroreductase family deazaflavin-dependent oxidoreductase [Candidatus Binataceae bacterium]